MTYAAVCEIMLHLNNFTIFDDYNEGTYRLRIAGYYEKGQQHVSNSKVETSGELKKYRLSCVVLEDQLWTGETRPFQSRVLEEKTVEIVVDSGKTRQGLKRIPIDLSILWKLKLSSYPFLWDEPVCLEVVMDRFDRQSGEFKEAVEVRTFELRSPVTSFVSYFDLNYQVEHMLHVDGLVSAALLEFVQLSEAECRDVFIQHPSTVTSFQELFTHPELPLSLPKLFDTYVGALIESFIHLKFLLRDVYSLDASAEVIEYTKEFLGLCAKYKVAAEDREEGSRS